MTRPPASCPPGPPRWSLALLLLVVGWGVFLRVEGLDTLPLFGDEYHSVRVFSRPLAEIVRSFDLRGSHIALPLMQHLSDLLVGSGVLAMRLPVLLAGVLSLLLCYPVARRLVGPLPALLATMALSLSPMHVYYSRFGRGYLPALLLGLALVDAASRATEAAGEARRGHWRRWVPVTLLVALLPYVHLTALALVGTMALCCLAQGWVARRRLANLVPALSAFALGLLLTGLMYLPAFDGVLAYLGLIHDEPSPGGVTALEVTTLLAGARWAGMVWLAALPLAALGMIRARPRGALWVLGAIAGPLLGLILAAPYGMAYAYARYLLISLPFVLMLGSWGLVEALRWLGSRFQKDGTGLATVLGSAALIGLHLGGPLSPWRGDDFPFSNSYLALHALPAFDVPDPQTSPLYGDIADDGQIVRIIEAPMLISRAALLYRNALLQHHKQVLVGLVADLGGPLAQLPYVPILDRAAVRSSAADLLILHLAVDAELHRYWSFVYDEAWPSSRSAGDEGFMLRHETYRSQTYHRLHALVPRLSERFGEPLYRDALVVAWRL